MWWTVYRADHHQHTERYTITTVFDRVHACQEEPDATFRMGRPAFGQRAKVLECVSGCGPQRIAEGL